MDDQQIHEEQELFDKFWQSLRLFNEVINAAIQRLEQDMEKANSFIEDRARYDEKNEYVTRANRIARISFTGHPYYADQFYRSITDAIIAYEARSSKRLNKGIVYANLGIAQIYQGKFDAGIAHLLTAESEDRAVAEPKEFILDTELWQQFEIKIEAYLLRISSNQQLSFANREFIAKFFREMNREDRIFLQGTLLALIDNMALLGARPNSFTMARLYAGLKDICLLIESHLRHSYLNRNPSKVGRRLTLYDFLHSAIPSWSKKGTRPYHKATDLQEFVNNLEDILSSSRGNLVQSIDCVYLIRNFTGHHFKIDENIKTPSGKTFFRDLYLLVLEKSIATLLYFKHIDAI